MQHPWEHFRSYWMGLWASWRCPFSFQGGWWPLKIPSNPKYYMMLWFCALLFFNINIKYYVWNLPWIQKVQSSQKTSGGMDFPAHCCIRDRKCNIIHTHFTGAFLKGKKWWREVFCCVFHLSEALADWLKSYPWRWRCIWASLSASALKVTVHTCFI